MEGEVEHGDNVGNSGVIGTGDVQWMSAGRYGDCNSTGLGVFMYHCVRHIHSSLYLNWYNYLCNHYSACHDAGELCMRNTTLESLQARAVCLKCARYVHHALHVVHTGFIFT